MAPTSVIQHNNVTKWSSTAALLNWYQYIKEYVTEMDIEVIADMIPSFRDNKRVDQLCVQFMGFESVTKALQKSNVSSFRSQSPFWRYDTNLIFQKGLPFPERKHRAQPWFESDRRRRIALMKFDKQIFRHANRSMWDTSDLSTLLDWGFWDNISLWDAACSFTQINTNNFY